MGVLLSMDDCCKQDNALKSSVLEINSDDNNGNLVKSNLFDNENKNNKTKQNLIILIVASNSLENCKININESEIEYQISNFYVIEQMKINAKILTPKTIYDAILVSNKDYTFLHEGFVYFTQGSSPLYKKFNIINNESSQKLIPSTLYYMFNTNYDHFLYEHLKKCNSNKHMKRSFDNLLKIEGNFHKSNNPSLEKFSDSYNTGIENRIRNKYQKLSNNKSKFETIGELDSINSSYQHNITINTNNLNSIAKN